MTTLLTATSLFSLISYAVYRIIREKYQTKKQLLTRIEKEEYKKIEKYGRVSLSMTFINIVLLLISKII